MGTTSPQGAFELDKQTYITDSVRNSQIVSEDRIEAARGVLTGIHRSIVSAAACFDEGTMLVGTSGAGFSLYAGSRLHPFSLRGAPEGQLSISALVRINSNLSAAAADGKGILIFDTNGQVTQVSGREMDHRLNAVQKLSHRDGILWGLPTEGILRVEVPSPISHFAPLAPTSFQFSRPTRHEGRLWILLADVVALRAEYSAEGRLTGLVKVTPPGKYVWTLASVNGKFLDCNELGIHRHIATEHGSSISQSSNRSWTLVGEDIINARIEARGGDGRWFYVANGSMGWIDGSDPLSFESYDTPELGEVYGAIQDASGTLWCELGSGQVGRININADPPTLTMLDTNAGLPPSWVQIWNHRNEPRFNVGGRIMFFDSIENRFRDDKALIQQHPDLAEAIGRPAVDAFGRLWMSAQGTTIVERTAAVTDAPAVPKIVGGIRPIGFVMEENGVVWLQSSQRLTRFDPAIPPQPLPAVKPVITRISLPNDGTVLFPPFDDLVLPHIQNSLVVHFLAPHNPFRQDVSFRLNLEGSGNATVPHTGGGRSATFSQLGGGDYQLKLQALVGDKEHETTTLAFTVLPPWYRSTPAYIAYAVAAVLLPLAVGAAVSYLNRREQKRLKELVSLRTAELETLNSSLEERVGQRTAELESANKDLESFSYSVSHDLRAPLRAISGFSTALMDDFPDKLGETGADFLKRIHAATGRMEQLIDAMLSLSRVSRHALTPATIDLSALAGEIVTELRRAEPKRVRETIIEPGVTITADPPLIRVVMENLLGNAWKYSSKRENARLEFRTESDHGQTVYVVEDNGAGFDSSLGGDPFAPFQRMHTKDERDRNRPRERAEDHSSAWRTRLGRRDDIPLHSRMISR